MQRVGVLFEKIVNPIYLWLAFHQNYSGMSVAAHKNKTSIVQIFPLGDS